MEKTSWFLANASYSIALMITIFFWLFLYDGVNTFENTFVHLLNSVRYLHLLNISPYNIVHPSVVVDLLLVARPAQLPHLVHPLACGGCYLLFSVLYWALGGTDPAGHPWIYPMVDWGNPGLALGTALGCLAGNNQYFVKLFFST